MTTLVREERFPTQVAYGLVAGPSFQTERVVTGAGYVKKNARWWVPLRRYQLDTALLTEAQAARVLAFIHAVAFGRLYNFRVKDFSDFRATDAPIGSGDGANRTFQLAKTYVYGAYGYQRIIRKPSNDLPLQVFVGGALQADNTYSIDMTTGVLTFAAGSTPAADAPITWSGSFDVPCEFDSDDFASTYQTVGHLVFRGVSMTEVRL